MKRTVIAAMILAIAAATGPAEGKKEAAAAPKQRTLSVAINIPVTEDSFKTVVQMGADFEAVNPGLKVQVDFLPYYEDTMKTRMAARDFPDAWSTHGWSVARYSEYLEPLNGQPWASKVNPTIKPVITDANGTFYVLPFDMDVAGIAFNRDVLDKAGVDPFMLKTWDDFIAACEKIKKTGKVAVHVGGNPAEDWTIGNFYDWTAPSFLITDEKENYRKALKDGTFDWKNWAPVAKLIVDFRDRGFLNPDFLQATWETVGIKIGTGEAAFGFFGNYVISEARKANPKGNFGFIPVPSASKSDSPSLITGERLAIGVWKDSKVKSDALAFLNFASKPEFVSRIATIHGIPTGLVGEGYKSDAGALTPYFEKIAGVRGFPYFDREYLPSGMWDSMCKTGSGLLAGTMTVAQACEKMKNDYLSLRTK